MTNETEQTVHPTTSRASPPWWPEKNIDDLCTLIFIKIHKCGSSTNGGVARGIASNRNLSKIKFNEEDWSSVRCMKNEECRVHANHGKASLFKNCRLESDNNSSGRQFSCAQRCTVRPNSFLWTVIRDPRTRALSHYFQANRQKAHADKDIIKWIKKSNPSHMYDYMDGLQVTKDKCVQAKGVIMNHTQHDINFVHCRVRHLLDSYDFVGILERQDESLVAMKLLFNLKLRDILYSSAKIRAESKFSSPEPSHKVYTYLNDEFFSEAYVDRILYEAVNAKLDATIARYGSKFYREYELFSALSKEARVSCNLSKSFHWGSDMQSVTEMENYSATHCYYKDAGCGYQCLHDFAAQFETYDT